MKQIANTRLRDAQATSSEAQTQASDLVEAGLLDSDAVDVDSLRGQAADVRLEGTIRSPRPRPGMVATELDELTGSAKTSIPLFQVGLDDGIEVAEAFEKAGWYEIDTGDVARQHPALDDVWRYDLSLSLSGRRGSHYRALAIEDRALNHPFGNDDDSLVWIPQAARKPFWFDPATTDRAVAVPIKEFIETAFGTLKRFDVEQARSAFGLDADDPVKLLYDPSYLDDTTLQVRSYDTRGHDDKFDGDGVRQWQTIHETRHDIDDPLALSNGRVRVFVTEPDDPDSEGELTAEQWVDALDEWVDIPVGTSDWKPVDMDIVDIRQHREVARITFRDESDVQLLPTELGGAVVETEFILAVGDERPQIHRPDGEDFPADLEEMLGELASERQLDPQPQRTLVSRGDVRT